MLFDWANQPFQTLIVTFIFAPYFAAEVIGDPVRGQALWGTAAAIGGATVAILAPLLGAVADRTGARKAWVLGFSAPYLLGCLGFWLAVPGMADPRIVLVAYLLAFLGSEFGQIFTNAMLPDLGPPREIGRISGSGWALGYLGGLVSLVVVLAFLAPAPGGDRTLIGIAPLFGLDPAAGEPARATGPLAALWYVVFALPLFLWTPDTPRRPAAGALRAGLADLAATIRQARRHGSLFTYLIASMIYRDALAALFTFGGIYAAGVLGWGLFQLGLFGIVAAGVGAVGAWAGGRADRAFGPRPVIVAAIWLLILVCGVILSTTRDQVLFLTVPEGSRLPDIVFFCRRRPAGRRGRNLAGGLAHAVGASGRGTGRQRPGLRALCAVGQGHRLSRAGDDRRRHRRDRVATAGGQPGYPAFPDWTRPAILGQNRRRAARGCPRMIRCLSALALAFALLAPAAEAQTAKALFAAKGTPTAGPTYSIGQNSKGCLAGAARLPETGPTWQAMRLSRNRVWGHPATIAFIERLSVNATRVGWRGLYVGDISQPRGGPVGGHASHQTGLDVDIWLLPPPRLDLSRAQRESLSANNVRSADQRHMNGNWTPSHAALLRAAARDQAVERIFITPPAKLAMCAATPPSDRAWLRKIRPWWGHNDHIHVRLNCPKGARGCVQPDPLPAGDGCADAVWWVTEALEPPDPKAPKTPPRPPLTLADLPPQCAAVLSAR